MQAVLQGADEDFAAVVGRHLGLLNEGDGRDQRLDGAAIVACGETKKFTMHQQRSF